MNTEVHEPSAKYLLARDGYQPTDVGLIPQEWSVKELRQIGNLSKGRGLLKEDIETSGAVPAIPYTALYTDFSEVVDYERIKWFVDDIAGTVVVNEPCVLIASSSNMAANTGKASAIPGTTPVAIGREVIIFRTDHSAVFFSYLLSTAPYRTRTLVLARGTTIKHLYPATFANYRVAVPPLVEQRMITEALGNVDALLAGLERLIAKKRDIKQAAMQQLLTGQTRLPGFFGDWGVQTLRTFVKSFIVPMRDKPKLLSGKIPWCRIEDFEGMYLADSKSGQGVDIETIRAMNLKVYPEGTLLVSCSADLGRCAIVQRPLVSNQTFIGLEFEHSKASNVFFYYLMTSKAQELNDLSSGTTISYLSREQFEEFKVLAPLDKSEQAAIGSVLFDIDAEISALQVRRDKNRAIKQGMMQELLTGRTRLI